MKSVYPIVSLKGFVQQVSIRNKGESDIEVYSVTNSEGFTTDYFSKEVFSKDVSNYKVVSVNQFAYNPSRINVGSVDYLRCSERVLVSPLYIVFETSKEIYPDYLFRYLKSDWGNLQIRANTEGAVRDSLKFKGLENIKIPLPPLDDQIRLAHLLGKVEGLIAQRKQHLRQHDDLLKSVFLEMFGPKNPSFEIWPLVEIKELAAKHKGAMRTGPFGSNLLHSEFTPDGDVAVLGIDNAVQNRFVWGERRYITNEKYKELENYRIFPGDVIVTIMGTIGRSAVILDNIPLAINTKHLAAITLDRKIANPLFLAYSIHSSPYVINQFKNKNRGAIMRGLNLTIIKETKIRFPPIEYQNEFAAIHTRIDGIKARYQQSLTELENLYVALSQKAFKGELDLSRAPLPSVIGKLSVNVSIPMLEAHAILNEVHTLPEPSDLKILTSKEGRKALILQWLNAWCEQLGDRPFSAQHFMETAQQRLWELAEDEAPEWGVCEYDHLKDWVFQALASGHLTQTYDDAGNRVQIFSAKG